MLIVLVGAAALLPLPTLHLARRNLRRWDGQRSRRRTRRELHHFAVFVRDSVLLPAAALLLLSASALFVHRYVIPDSLLAEVFGTYHPEVALNAPDIEAWELAAQEARAYAAQLREQGIIPAFSLREWFWEHWPLHPLFALLLSGGVYWTLSRRYPAAARAYHDGVRERRARYARRDLDRSTGALRRPRTAAAAPPRAERPRF